MMDYRRLGRTGMRVSALGLGTMTFGWTAQEATAREIMDVAVDRGINFFDTADIYSRWDPRSHAGKTEEIIGRWLTGRQRDRILIATKVRGPMSDAPTDQGLSRHHIIAGIEGSLKRLQTDYVDLYQTHFPDGDTPMEETLRALEDLVRSGKVRYIGCSNHRAWELCKALWISDKHGWSRYDSLQPHYNLVNRAEVEREITPLCLDQGIGLLPYSPLAGGFLSGKYRRGQSVPHDARGASNERIKGYMTEQNWKLIDLLHTIGDQHKASVAAVALSWVTDAPAVASALVGANSVKQLQESLAAAELHLSAEEREQLDAASSFTP
ncbi:MAG: aldo/keto reductase [Herpetosiphon sp.]